MTMAVLPPLFLVKEAVEYPPVRWLIDGYNVLRRDADLRAREAESLEAGRAALLRLLAVTASASGESFTVVFDGARRGQAPAEGQVTVVFSRPPETADDMLERLARTAGAGSVVVSSDRRVKDAGRRAGCAVVTAEQFLDAVRHGSAPGDDTHDGGEDDTDERPGKHGNPRRRSRDEVLAARALNRLRPDRPLGR
jgi:predicted RNA-binding protein with PIN domain